MWLGHEIATAGKVLFISAEEPEREIRRRIWLHAQRDGYDPNTLTDLHLWLPDKSGDAVMAVVDRYSGIMQPTRIMQEIAAGIRDLAPVLAIVDNVAATCAGNQVDRLVARSYVNLWRQIAQGPSKPAVLLLDHPSLSGMTNNTGRGGSMDWRNAVRSALWLHQRTIAPRPTAASACSRRQRATTGRPETRSDCYGRTADCSSSTRRRRCTGIAKDAECDATFLRLLDEREGQGFHVSGEARAATYCAPRLLPTCRTTAASARNAFAAAMERLLQAGKIHQVFEGPASRPRGRLVRQAAAG